MCNVSSGSTVFVLLMLSRWSGCVEVESGHGKVSAVVVERFSSCICNCKRRLGILLPNVEASWNFGVDC